MIQPHNTPKPPAYTPSQTNALIAVVAGLHVAAAGSIVVSQDRSVPVVVLAGGAAALALTAAVTYGYRSRVGAPAPPDPTAHVLMVLLGCGTLLWPALVLMLWPSVLAVLLGLGLSAVWVTVAGLLVNTWRARNERPGSS